MFRIKVCGVTSADDASLAVEAGADAVGINFFPGSVRYVSPREAAPIVGALGNEAAAVGVFVNEPPEKIARICEELGIGVVQLSGRETAEDAGRIRLPLIRAVPMGGGQGIDPFRDYPCSSFLLDAAIPGNYGGTGVALDWEELGRTIGGPVVLSGRKGPSSRARPWMLAGGLTPENVREAIMKARPFGVDVASGVEAVPGKKDRKKVRDFVENAKEGFRGCGI